MFDVLDSLRQVVTLTPVGSRVTCSPIPPDADEDYLVLSSADVTPTLYTIITQDGWKFGGSVIEDSANTVPVGERFESFTVGDLNLIVTHSEIFHRRFLAATAVAKRLNLLAKPDRIALFQAVLYGNH